MRRQTSRRELLVGGSAALGLSSVAGRRASAQSQPVLKVMTFPGVTNFPIFAAQHKGLFAKHGIAIELLYTPNSQLQRAELANGNLQIIQTAADNSVAMVEVSGWDSVIVTGGDSGFNQIIVQPEINSLSDIRGKTIVTDAPDTGFAFLLYNALKNAGVERGAYAVNSVGGTGQRLEAMIKDKKNVAGIMGLPFSIRATEIGLKDLGSAYQSIGAYQSDCAVVMRDWARANPDTLVRYIAAMIEARRWIFEPANKGEALQLLGQRLQISPVLAERIYSVVTNPVSGMAKDAKFDAAGFRNVLKLRAEMEGRWGGTPPAAEKYIDLSYYDRAIAGL